MRKNKLCKTRPKVFSKNTKKMERDEAGLFFSLPNRVLKINNSDFHHENDEYF